MRVAHFGYADTLPGAARASYRLHRAMLQHGVTSRMIVWNKLSADPTVHGPPTRLGQTMASHGPLLDYAPLRVLQAGRREVSPAWLDSGQIGRVVRADPDVVQLHWICAGLVRPRNLREIGHKHVVWRLPDMWAFTGVEHYAPESGGWMDGYTGPSEWPTVGRVNVDRLVWRQKAAGYGALDSLTIVTPSRWLAGLVKRSKLLGDRRVEVISTGTDLRAFAPMAQAEARRQLGLPLDAKVVLFGANGGGLNPRKGYTELISAAEHLSALPGIADLRFVTFGGGGETKVGPWPVTDLGRLRYPDDVARAYAASDVFVAPSVAENLANTVLESLAAGTPVVAFDIGGMSDAVDHQANGYLARPGDTTDLAGGIRWVLEHANSSDLRTRAREIAVERFDDLAQAARYIDLYADLMDEQKA